MQNLNRVLSPISTFQAISKSLKQIISRDARILSIGLESLKIHPVSQDCHFSSRSGGSGDDRNRNEDAWEKGWSADKDPLTKPESSSNSGFVWDSVSSWSTGLTKEHFDGEAVGQQITSETDAGAGGSVPPVRPLSEDNDEVDEVAELEKENSKSKDYVDSWSNRMKELNVWLKQVREPGARGSYLKDSEKAEMYRLHKENPEIYTVERLAKDYRIMRQRVHAILWLKELEEEEKKKLGHALDDSVELLLDTCPESLWQSRRAIQTHLSLPMSEKLNFFKCFSTFPLCSDLTSYKQVRYISNASVSVKMENDVIKFSVDELPSQKNGAQAKVKKKFKRVKMSRKAKLNELRFYRLKAKKKMTSPNPEVRIRYKLEKAKRKEEWLIEKLQKFELPIPAPETYDPEILTEEEMFYLKRIGEKKKNYVPVGRRGVFGGVVLNMHLHWKKHETVKVVCKPCRPGQVHEYAEELARLSKGIVIGIKDRNTIIFYRGKNYVQPRVMSPPDTLSKSKALEKYKYEQSLEHTSQFIEKLEKELEEFHEHILQYRKSKEVEVEDSPSSI